MTWVDTLVAFAVLAFIFLLVWSRIQNQTMKETFNEIKDIITGGKEK